MLRPCQKVDDGYWQADETLNASTGDCCTFRVGRAWLVLFATTQQAIYHKRGGFKMHWPERYCSPCHRTPVTQEIPRDPNQGLVLVHVKAQLERLQDTFMC